jgi:hypothetical protein
MGANGIARARAVGRAANLVDDLTEVDAAADELLGR